MSISDASPGPSLRRRGLSRLAGLAVLGAAAAPALGTVVADAVPGRRLRLRRDPGSVVSALDVPLGTLTARARPQATVRTPVMETTGFSMLGVTWRGGSGHVRARVRRAGGSWTEWQVLRRLHDGPDPSSDEGRRTPRATEPTWVGRAEAVQLELTGAPRDPVLALIDPGRRTHDVDVDVQGPGLPGVRSRRAAGGVPRPELRTRSDWGADPDLRSGNPVINRTIQQMHVHHTVNSNDYSRRDVPALIRGMYRYHTQSLGWSDIGYNFLVDRFGRIWIGRAGGPGRPVRGAHTLGFNETSFGVSVIGNFESHTPNDQIIIALGRIAAWKLDKHGRDPRGATRVYSHGSDRYPAGTRVRLPVIDGHSDTNETACPGGRLYVELPRIRRRAARRIRTFNRPS